MRTFLIIAMAILTMVCSAPTMALDLILGQQLLNTHMVAQVEKFSGTSDGVSYANQKALDEGPKQRGNVVHHAIIITATQQTDVWGGDHAINYASFSTPIDISRARSATLQILSTTTHNVTGYIPAVTFSLWVKPGIVASATNYVKIAPSRGYTANMNLASFVTTATRTNTDTLWPLGSELGEYGTYHYDFRDQPYAYARIDFAKDANGNEDVAAVLTVYNEPGD